MTTESNATPVTMSANAADFHATIQWIQRQKAKGYGSIHMPSNKLYPFLHIEESTEHDESIIEAWSKMRHFQTVFQATKTDEIKWEWARGLHIRMQTGTGSNHIYFVDPKIHDPALTTTPRGTRIAIIYFDPYEI